MGPAWPPGPGRGQFGSAMDVPATKRPKVRAVKNDKYFIIIYLLLKKKN
jgi:hypothetical protein